MILENKTGSIVDSLKGDVSMNFWDGQKVAGEVRTSRDWRLQNRCLLKKEKETDRCFYLNRVS